MSTVENSLITIAAEENVSTKMMEKIIESFPDSINDVDQKGNTVLARAIKNNNNELAKLLLSKGANPNIIGTISIASIAYQREDYDMVESMIKRGLDINDVCKEHFTLLMLIGINDKGDESNDKKFIKLLLNNGINIDQQNEPSNITALMASCSTGKLFMVNNLIEMGANLDLVNNEGASALIFAVKKNDIKIAEALLDGGADINLRTNKGNSAINFATKNVTCNEDLVELLIKRGCEVDKNCDLTKSIKISNLMDKYESNGKESIIKAINNGDFIMVERMSRMNKDLTDDDKNDLILKVISTNNTELFSILFKIWY